MFMILVHGTGNLISGLRKQPHTVVLLTVLAATAVTIKLSNLAFSAVVMGFVLVYVWKTSNQRIRGVVHSVLPAVMVCAIWCLRGFVLSGAPLYPSTIGYIPVEWAVPMEKVIDEANWVYSWARRPGTHWSTVLGGWSWFEPWILSISRKGVGVVYPCALFIVASVVTVTMSVFKKGRKLRFVEWAIPLSFDFQPLFLVFHRP